MGKVRDDPEPLTTNNKRIKSTSFAGGSFHLLSSLTLTLSASELLDRSLWPRRETTRAKTAIATDTTPTAATAATQDEHFGVGSYSHHAFYSLFFSSSPGSIRDGLYITQSHARQRRRRRLFSGGRERGGAEKRRRFRLRRHHHRSQEIQYFGGP